MKKFARIIGTGSYLPSKVVTNFDLEKTLDWIYSEPRNKSQLNKMLLELIPAN